MEARPQLSMESGRALIERGRDLYDAGQPREAAALFDQVTREFNSSTAPEARILVAQALYNKGIALTPCGEDEGQAAFHQFRQQFGSPRSPCTIH